MLKKVLFAFVALFSFPLNAEVLIDAQKVQHIGVFDDWNAYIYTSKKDKVCFVSSMPLRSTGEYTRRGDVFLLISSRPNEEIYDTVTFVAGYTFMPRSEALLRVGKVKADLFTSEDTAWAKNMKTDAEIARAMNTGVRLTVKGVTVQGIETHDVFSLKGFNNAMDAINRLCRQPAGKNE